MGLRIDWVRGLPNIEGLCDVWTALENEVQQRTCYARFDYIIPWYRCYAETSFSDYGKPLVGVAWEGQKVVGLAAMLESKSTFAKIPVRRADFAGYNLAAGEFLIQGGSLGVAEAIVDDLRGKLGFELVNINGLSIKSEAYTKLATHLNDRRVPFYPIDFHGYAIADLRQGYQAYTKTFGWKFRSRNKGIAKKIESSGEIRIERLNSTKDRERARQIRARMIDITENSRRVRLAGVDVERRHQPFYDELFERFGAQDAIDVAILVVNGEDAAYVFGLLERNVYYHTMMSYRESLGHLSPGKYLLQEVLRYLPDLGYAMVLSHGSYEYKNRWASEMVPQHTICVFGNGLRASLAHKMGDWFVRGQAGPNGLRRWIGGSPGESSPTEDPAES